VIKSYAAFAKGQV